MIYVIGVGLAGKESFPVSLLKKIESAEMLVGSARHLTLFTDYKGEVVKLAKLEPAIKKISALIKKKKSAKIVVLATGDPGLFGIGELITKKFGKKSVRIIPNVSTVQEAFARINESWNGAKIISAHGIGADGERSLGSAVETILGNMKTVLFTDPKNTPACVARALLERGAEGLTAYVFEALGTKREKITRATLSAITKKKFDQLNLMIFIRGGIKKTAAVKLKTPGLPDDRFIHRKGLITKSEVRAITLSKLAPADGDVIWDVGSGSGSVAIEAELLTSGSRVFAIEEKPPRVHDIKKNALKLGATNLFVIKGTAPESLKGLPRPDKVFIGGGGEGVKKILSFVSKKIKPGAVVVVNAVTIDTVTAATGFFKRGKWDFELAEVNVAKTKDVAGLSLLCAGNPVFIIKGVRR
ncbi:MAG: precorrin-6y C5,15-methyltransferase (decarboxylating) subunit CbiE [Thermodesulfobacteriota bacterium]